MKRWLETATIPNDKRLVATDWCQEEANGYEERDDPGVEAGDEGSQAPVARLG